MANEYLTMANRASLNAKIEITKKAQREIIDLYSKAIDDLSKKLKSTGGLKEAYIKSRIRGLNAELEHLIEQYSMESAESAVTLHKGTLEEIVGRTGHKLQFDRLFGNIPTEVLQVMREGGIYKDGAGLSARIWDYTGSNAKYIEDIIYSGIAEGTNAFDLANLLEDYVNPKSRKNWNNEKIKELLGPVYASKQQQVEYNALRLARTSIAHSFTIGNKLSAQRNPFIEKFKWHSVFAHGRTCEECKEKDGQIYKIEDLPFDHPNGLCWEEPVYEKSLDEYTKEIGEWLDGGKNANLDKWYEEYGEFFK